LTETSTNKPEIDEDEEKEEEEEEEEDHWKDASPITPICSPARRPPKFHHRDKRSPTIYVDVDNDVEIIHEFYPTTSKTMLEETSIVSYGGTIIVETTRIPRHTKDAAARMEKVTPKVKLKKQSSLDVERVPPVREEPSSPKVVEEAVEVTAKTSPHEADKERAKSLKRHSSAESEGRTSTSRETLEKSDTSSEKGAKKKVFAEKEDGKRRSKRSGKRSVKTERRAEEDSSRRKRGAEDEESSRRKDDETYRRSREERKSLKEQECIERVTEFLTRHSVSTYPEMSVGLETTEPSEIVDEQRGKRPSISKEGETAGPSMTPASSIASTKRKESLKSVPEVEETKDLPGESSKVAAKDVGKPSEGKKRPTLERTPAAVSDVQQSEATAVREPPKRPSSLRKRRDSFSRESSRESLLEEKKGVRIQEDVQEIFFEDTSEQVSDPFVSRPTLAVGRGIIAHRYLSRIRCDIPDCENTSGNEVVKGRPSRKCRITFIYQVLLLR